MDFVVARKVEEEAPKPDPAFFQPTFKLVAPPHPGDKRFRPESTQVRYAREVDLMSPPKEVPQAAPVMKQDHAPAPVKAPSERPTDDAQVLARIERMMRSEQRCRDLEDENRVLTKTIARLQAEIDNLKGSTPK